MKEYIVKNEWEIIEEGFHPQFNRITESLLSLGNGYMGQRANFEETYSGDTLQGNYIGGIYYPDKTRVGWWKNGYPEYFAKVLNACDWIALEIKANEEILDLHNASEIKDFSRRLDMKSGVLHRSFEVTMSNQARFKINAQRFISMHSKELGAIQYSIESLNFNGNLDISSILNFKVINEDRNYKEVFWEPISEVGEDRSYGVSAKTKKTDFHVAAAMANKIYLNGTELHNKSYGSSSESLSSEHFRISIKPGDQVKLEKFVAVATSMHYEKDDLSAFSTANSALFAHKGYDALLHEHKKVWKSIWDQCDILIDGDVSAQQGIRFNIFQLYQTYTGDDDRLNIGPKGFTGEKYGGSTYWDTEAYCIPFYLGTANSTIAKNLLIYRYNQLPQAIENAKKLGFRNGAALYPMVTMNGEECHNEWEITFEEIHRNGAIAYAIFDYIRYTNDRDYMAEYGLEVLIAIARFWSQRVNFSKAKNKYVMLGVTGPNEYENNINNNWYTNYIAKWCMDYAATCIQETQSEKPERWNEIAVKVSFKDVELSDWESISKNMYFPQSNELGIFLQQDNFLDKEILPAESLDQSELPINQNWSWDRILRSCYIKQADVLQGLYFFEDHFDLNTIKRNFDYYEPITVHESSLSPCIHSILACDLGYDDKAYEMYLRTSRLDLNDYNNDTEDGCHITSMAGTWMSIIKGFGGQKIKDGKLSFAPQLPAQWDSLSFKLNFRGLTLQIIIKNGEVHIRNLSEARCELFLFNELVSLDSQEVHQHKKSLSTT